MQKPQLFLLHFAGGNCHSFQFMAPWMKSFDVIALELPGRGRRMDEELLHDFDMAAADLYRQVIQKIRLGSFLIYGHSMGAYLALRVAGMLEKAGKFPAYLIVSGNAGPGIHEQKKIYLLEQAAFLEELKKLGGVPDEFIGNAELLEFFEPILRADFEIAERNDMQDEPAITAPLLAMMGSSEEKIQEISNWGRFTKSEFRHELLEGDHFFIHKHPEKIARLIRDCYDRTVLLQQ